MAYHYGGSSSSSSSSSSSRSSSPTSSTSSSSARTQATTTAPLQPQARYEPIEQQSSVVPSQGQAPPGFHYHSCGS